MTYDWSKPAKHFSVNSYGKCWYQVSSWVVANFPFSAFLIFFSLLSCYFSGIFCTFHLGQTFVGFLSKTFWFLLQYEFKFFIDHNMTFMRQVCFCINFSEKKINCCCVLCKVILGQNTSAFQMLPSRIYFFQKFMLSKAV